MASVMGICGVLVGPKSENVEKALVLPLLFEGSRGPRGRQSRERNSEPSGKIKIFVKNASWLYSELCFLLQRGTRFHKNREKSGRMVKNGAKIMSDTSLLHQAGVGYIKMS